MGMVKAVCVSASKGTRKQAVASIELRAGHGIPGDAHAGDWHRQVSLLSEASIDKMRKKGLALGYGDFAENVVTEGMELHTLPVGTRLVLGGALAEVTQIGKTCHAACEIARETGTCIMPTEGIFVRILTDGELRAGDGIEVFHD